MLKITKSFNKLVFNRINDNKLISNKNDKNKSTIKKNNNNNEVNRFDISDNNIKYTKKLKKPKTEKLLKS